MAGAGDTAKISRLGAPHSSAPKREVKPVGGGKLCETRLHQAQYKKFMHTINNTKGIFQGSRFCSVCGFYRSMRTPPGYAAETAAVFAPEFSFPGSSQRTLTSFETPGSCMVTP